MADRMHPSFFGGRYYHLVKLRECNEAVIAKYFSGKKIGKLLDYGCGTCPYKSMYVPYVDQYAGADIPPNPVADISIELETGHVDAPDAAFDAILSTQVLEHVTDPAIYLKEANRLLKQDGMLFLSTHGYWIYHPDPTDFWRWTRDGLEKTIAREGFEIVETFGIMNRFASGLQIFQDALIFKLPQPLKWIWCGFFAAMQWILDNGRLDNRDASVFLVVARKKTSVTN
jgi:SAM-dependent methyltransferase